MSKVLLITGGSRGIGAAVARLAAAEGYAVGLNYRERDDAAAALVAEITAAGGTARAMQADVASEADVERLFAEVENELGQLAALVNSAGIGGQRASVVDFSGERLRRLMGVNVVGTMLCCREAARRMSSRLGGAGGAIVNVSSMAATVGGRPGSSDYAASKAAVDSFTVGFAREVATEGIRVNSLRPGMTQTDMTDHLETNPAKGAFIASTIPMRRIAGVDEVARPILWLLSDAASFITGACIDVSGGGFDWFKSPDSDD